MGMNRTFKSAVAALMVAIGLAGSVAAGPFEDAAAAVHQGDHETGLRLYRQLAEQGDARAQLQLGLRYDDGWKVPQDRAEAARWFRKAAVQGNADAAYFLASKYEHGEGVPQDYAEAVRWYRIAAERGYDLADVNVGLMYYEGKGVVQNYIEAVKWFRKAADSNDVEAQYQLGLMYYDGHGIPQDYMQAHMWLNIAASHIYAGDKESRDERDEIIRKRNMAARKMTPAQIAEAQKLAREWKPK
jgi:TPR repeat protein